VALMNMGHVEQCGPPREMYEKPATPFVRDFLGRTVLLRGKMSDSGQAAVHLDAMPSTPLQVPRMNGDGPSPGTEVFVAIRPEDIQVRTGDGGSAGANELAGTVEALLFVGDHYECRVSLGNDASVLLHLPRSTVLREGEPVRVYVAPEGISVWPQ
jgi:ABC-type Fe3+/spermidine/putrescine transport system ATPase subunit